MNKQFIKKTDMFRKKAALIMIIILFFSAVGGCTSKEEESMQNTLVYGSTDYTAINPALFEHGEINSLLFLGLTAHDADNNVVPAAAESWSYDKNDISYHFKLREGLTFHDGELLTSSDVKFTVESIMNPDNNSENASNFEDVKSVDIIDDYNLVIKLKAPNVAILDYLTIGILPEHLLSGEPLSDNEFNQSPVGAGPYMMTSWDFGQSITLESFDDFYLGSPKIERIIFKIVDDSDARALQLKSGEIDLAQVAPKSMNIFEGNDGYTVYKMDTSDYRGIMYNFNSDFFAKHRELPSILSYAIDRQAIVDSVLLGNGEAAYSPLQKTEFNNPDMKKPEYDPDMAVKLLQENGWVRGEDGYFYKDNEQLAFEINNGQADQVRIDISNICAKYLKDIGVNATVKITAETDWEKQDSYLIGWGSPFDPDDHTYKVFGTGKGANYSYYSNEKIDDILKSARETDDKPQRIKLYNEFQDEFAADPPYTLIAYIDSIYVAKNNINGITENTLLGHHGVGIFWNVYDWEIQQID